MTNAAPASAAARPHPVTTLYPLLLAVFPALWVASTSTGAFAMDDLLTIVGAVLVFTALVFVACIAFVRVLGRDNVLGRAALLTMLVVGWVCYYIPLQLIVATVANPLAQSKVFGPVCVLVSIVILWLVLRRRWTVGGAGKFLTLAGALLVASSAVRVTRADARSRQRVAQSAMWRLVHQPVPVNPALARPGPKRDIYLIVLDGYPNNAVMHARFGFDNTPFLDSLRTLGFTIPQRARSNYTATVLSMSSILNFEHDTLLSRDLKPNDNDQTLPRALIQDNRTARFLRDRGYQYLLFAPEWFDATRRSPLATYAYQGPPHVSLVAELQQTELRRFVFKETLLSKFAVMRRNYGGEYMLDEFQRLREVPSRPEPTFTFAHFLLPHQPIVLDGDCKPRNDAGMIVGERAGMPGTQDLFLGAVRCGNRQILSVVTEILKRSTVPPIIILIGDHGTLTQGWPNDAHLPVDSVAVERLAPLAAFYMPDGGDVPVRDSVTHVNIFRHTLHHYFGADLPPLSNEAFFTQAGEAYLFRPVDERVVLGG
ncbi:MAG: hypothetical protein JO180_00125 [Gemmatirosa sp.]|nr:hypothetical protein [Gemmatirosa sp.]